VVLNYCTRGMIELRVRNTRLPIFCDLLVAFLIILEIITKYDWKLAKDSSSENLLVVFA
jgi:hypothetical protein